MEFGVRSHNVHTTDEGVRVKILRISYSDPGNSMRNYRTPIEFCPVCCSLFFPPVLIWPGSRLSLHGCTGFTEYHLN